MRSSSWARAALVGLVIGLQACGDSGDTGNPGDDPTLDGGTGGGSGAGGRGTGGRPGTGGGPGTGGAATGGAPGTGGDVGAGGDGAGGIDGAGGDGAGGDGAGGAGAGGDGAGGAGAGGLEGAGGSGTGASTATGGSGPVDGGADSGADADAEAGSDSGSPPDGGPDGSADGAAGPDAGADAADGADGADGAPPPIACTTSTDCGDTNVCDGRTLCVAGFCVGFPAPVCTDDTNVCTQADCDPVAGCIQRRLTGPTCDDGEPCTAESVCLAGVCTGTTAESCDDQNPCTTEQCLTGIGCLVSPNNAACNDGNACTADACFNGGCRGVAIGCDDSNPCTADTCDPATGCVHTPVSNGTACSGDGNPCTVDTCQGGQCNTPVPAGTLECRAASCTGTAPNAAATEQAFCDGNGDCPAPVLTSCGTQPCSSAGTGCQGVCTSDANCPSGFFCTAAGSCSAKRSPGGACTRVGQCISNLCVDGVCCTSACGGGNPNDCQACNGSGTCAPLTGTSCNDGNACTATDTCAAGTCGGTIGTCPDDNNPCTIESCDPVTGCSSQAAPNGTSCSDGNACTGADSCQGGTCQPGAPLTCDNGVFCDGQETCSTTLGCQPGTPVTCPADDATCTTEFCDENLNACRSVAQDSACSDSLFCNGSEHCDPDASSAPSGCVAGTPPSCNDGVACTTNACDEANDRCQFTPQNSACGNNDVCDGIETCDAQLGCQPGTALTCNDGISCTTNGCNPTTGCTYTPNNAACNDGLYCNGTETCNPAASSTATGCVAGTPVVCQPTDVIACTSDVCNEATDACIVQYNNASCPSGQACTSAGCGSSCTTDANCTDGNACNGAETCDLSLGSPGRCVAGTPPAPCNDNRSCTTDSCTPATGACVFTPNNGACADTNLCNGTETCSPSSPGANAQTGCLAGTPLDCSDTFSCTTESCSPQFGCQLQVDNAACDDGIICNGEESCSPFSPQAGTDGCVTPGPLECPDDGIACTTESCSEVAGGCVSVADNSACPCGQTCSATGGGCGNFCNVSTCQGQVYACGDCVDNDGDCKIDTLGDEHCLGPCSDNESGFKGEISGQDHGNCTADCYFDKDDGAGNDTCGWDHDCDPLSINYPGTPGTPYPDYTPSRDSKCDYSNNNAAKTTSCNGMMADQPDTCYSTANPPPGATKWNYCGALVPNGCDCFGCCAIPGAPTTVFLGSRLGANDPGTCNIMTLGDPTLCYPCTQVTSCLNPCETCEICVGKPTLPGECTCQTCAPGQQLCGGSCGTPCPAGEFCLTGCCAANPE